MKLIYRMLVRLRAGRRSNLEATRSRGRGNLEVTHPRGQGKQWIRTGRNVSSGHEQAEMRGWNYPATLSK